MFWLLAGTVFVLGLVILNLMIYYQMTYWKKRGVTTAPIVPIFGSNYKLLFDNKSMPLIVKDMYEVGKGKRYVGTMDFFKPGLTLRDPELIKNIAVKNFEQFPNHQNFADEEVDPLFGKNLFVLKDERWKEMRNTLSPTFSSNKLKIMYELLVKKAREYVTELEQNKELQKNFEAKDTFTRYANDVIASVAFGLTVNSIHDRENEFYLQGKKAMTSVIFQIIKIGMIRILPKWVLKALGITFFSKTSMNYFTKIIEETVKMRKQRGIVRPDMIQQLMQACEKNEKLTIMDIVAQGFVFFFAGFDTIALFMSYMAYELAFNPDVQEKLREEIDCHMDENNDQISYEMISKMIYLNMVTSETLRKYPSLPITNRMCKKAYTIRAVFPGEKDILIEEGSLLTIPIYAIHHDSEYFPDPEKFDPERFSEENKDKILPYTYIPFGMGPRMCIANRFALMEGKILITNLLRKFVLKPHEKARMPVVFSKKNFSTGMDGGYWINLEMRQK